jgi:hypothetical protein
MLMKLDKRVSLLLNCYHIGLDILLYTVENKHILQPTNIVELRMYSEEVLDHTIVQYNIDNDRNLR